MKYNLENLIRDFNSKKKLKFLFFWGHTENIDKATKACFSQWYNCKFIVDEITYHTAEQYMMAQKALLFNDNEIFNEIMRANHPKEYKELGRKIKNFSEVKWNESKYQIVLKGNIAKFSQNEKLKAFLLNTGTKILVEASPYDKIWGIGLSANEENIENPLTWKGENLLGFALMEVRDLLNQ